MEKKKERFFVSGKHIASFALFINSIVNALIALVIIFVSAFYGFGTFYGTYEMVGKTSGFIVIFGGRHTCETYTKSVNSYYEFNTFANLKDLYFSPKVLVIILIFVSLMLLAVNFLAFKKRLKKFNILAFIATIISLITFIVSMEILNIGLGSNKSGAVGSMFRPNEPIIKFAISTYVELVIATIIGILLIPIKDGTPPEEKRAKQERKQRIENDYPFLG